jgi:hypothetical protein
MPVNPPGRQFDLAADPDLATGNPTLLPDTDLATGNPTLLPDTDLATGNPTLLPDTDLATGNPTLLPDPSDSGENPALLPDLRRSNLESGIATGPSKVLPISPIARGSRHNRWTPTFRSAGHDTKTLRSPYRCTMPPCGDEGTPIEPCGPTFDESTGE